MNTLNDRMKRDLEEAEGRRKEIARLSERQPIVNSRSICVDPKDRKPSEKDYRNV